MRMTWVKYYAPWKSYAWLIIDDKNKYHWYKNRKNAKNHLKGGISCKTI